MIDIPGKLPPALKERISTAYYEMLEQLEREADGKTGEGRLEIEGCDTGAGEFPRLVEETCGVLRARGRRWQSKSADLAEVFLVIVQEGRFSNKAVSEHARNCAKAALAYLVKKLDVIPDHDSVTGFLDDAWILVLAAGKLKDDDQELYELIEAELK